MICLKFVHLMAMRQLSFVHAPPVRWMVMQQFDVTVKYANFSQLQHLSTLKCKTVIETKLFLKNQFTQIFTSLFYYFTVASHGDGKRLFVINLMNIQYSNGSHGSMIALFTINFEPSCPKSKQYWIYKSIGYYLGGTPQPSWR